MLTWLALQYTTNYKRGAPLSEIPQKTQYVGNSLKSLHNSVNASLKKLRTDHIDILYVHWWDYTTSIEEVMNGLHNLVTQGKVLYLGVSDTPAWIVSKANTYARLTGKTPFVIYQGAWNIMQRDFERDILPMALHEGTSPETRRTCTLLIMRAQAWLWLRGTSLQRAKSARTRRSSAVSTRAREAVPCSAIGSVMRSNAKYVWRSRRSPRRLVRRASPLVCISALLLLLLPISNGIYVLQSPSLTLCRRHHTSSR